MFAYGKVWGVQIMKLTAAEGHIYKYALIGRGASGGRFMGIKAEASRGAGGVRAVASLGSASSEGGSTAFGRVQVAGLGSVVQAG